MTRKPGLRFLSLDDDDYIVSDLSADQAIIYAGSINSPCYTTADGGHSVFPVPPVQGGPGPMPVSPEMAIRAYREAEPPPNDVRHIGESIPTPTDSVESVLSIPPILQDRGWRLAWAFLEAVAGELSKPSMKARNRDTLLARREELCNYYIQCLHLEDALIVERPKKLTKKKVLLATNSNDDLKLIADLANLAKHRSLDRPPRTGTGPVYGEPLAVARSGVEGWFLRLEIVHGTEIHDGVELATKGVEAWHRILQRFGLI